MVQFFLTESVLFSKQFLLLFKLHEMTLMDKKQSPENADYCNVIHVPSEGISLLWVFGDT